MSPPVLPPSGGPYVSLAVLCQRWTRDEIGTYSIHGMADSVTWRGGARRPNGTYAARPRIDYVLELCRPETAYAELAVELSWIDAHGRRASGPERYRLAWGEDSNTVRIFERLRLPDLNAGTYRLRASAGYRVLAESLLRVSIQEGPAAPTLAEVGIDLPPSLRVARHCAGLFDVPGAEHSLLGLFEGLGIDTPARVRMGFVVSFKAGTYHGSHSIAVTTYDPTGAICSPTYTWPLEFTGEHNDVGIRNTAHEIAASTYGTYWTEVTLDGQVLSRVPLAIYQPGTREERGSDHWRGQLDVIGDAGSVTVHGHTRADRLETETTRD